MRSLWLLLILFSLLKAGGNLEFYATGVDSNITHMHAVGDVLVLFDEYYLSANEAIYERNSSTLELFGNIIAMKKNDYFAMGDYARINTAERERYFSPFFMLDKGSLVWLSSLEAKEKESDFVVEEGMVSGCDPNDPLWQIYFSRLDYNAETKWSNLYNARLHLYGVPVFYFPYFGYSLDFERRSGLLIPSFGLSSAEGFYYQQPLYIAVDNSWDLELRPQIRTRRGGGLYSTLRFVDSNVSKGSLSLGYFKEKTGYANEYDLAHEDHYGFDFRYENYAFLERWFGLKLSGQSGLYADVSMMNDIDYINLSENDETKNATSNQILSRINTFYNEDKHYYGMYMRYYQDMNLEDNGFTLQNLPTLQYHHYLDTLFDDHILYNADVVVRNLYRPKGKKALQAEVDIPVSLQMDLFDDYLNVGYTAYLFGQYSTFSGTPEYSNVISKGEYNNGMFGRFYHVMNASTHLSRGYENYAHTIELDATYTKAGVDYRSGYYDDKKNICSRPDAGENFECDFYAIKDVEEILKLQFAQYLFDSGGKQKLYHRLIQHISFDPQREKLSELENELEYQVTDTISFYTDTFYNYQRDLISKSINTMRYDDKKINFGITDLYESRESEEGPKYTNYLTLDASYRHSSHYNYFGKYAYDLEESITKFFEVGFLYSKRCWDFGLRYVENNRPILTRNNADSVFDKYIYFTIMLRPIGGTDISYKLSNALDGF